jgi:hypothetical protein
LVGGYRGCGCVIGHSVIGAVWWCPPKHPFPWWPGFVAPAASMTHHSRLQPLPPIPSPSDDPPPPPPYTLLPRERASLRTAPAPRSRVRSAAPSEAARPSTPGWAVSGQAPAPRPSGAPAPKEHVCVCGGGGVQKHPSDHSLRHVSLVRGRSHTQIVEGKLG